MPLSRWETLTDSVQRKIGDKGTCVIWGHLGDRNIHLNIGELRRCVFNKSLFTIPFLTQSTLSFINLPSLVAVSEHDEDLGCLIEPDIYKETMAMSGSISAEHGVGVAKAKYITDALGDVAVDKMTAIKRVFDPNAIMNPGKLF